MCALFDMGIVCPALGGPNELITFLQEAMNAGLMRRISCAAPRRHSRQNDRRGRQSLDMAAPLAECQSRGGLFRAGGQESGRSFNTGVPRHQSPPRAVARTSRMKSWQPHARAHLEPGHLRNLCRSPDHGQRPIAWQQGSEKTQKTQTGSRSGWVRHPANQADQAGDGQAGLRRAGVTPRGPPNHMAETAWHGGEPLRRLHRGDFTGSRRPVARRDRCGGNPSRRGNGA